MKPKQNCQRHCIRCGKYATIECPHSYWTEDIKPATNYCMAWESA